MAEYLKRALTAAVRGALLLAGLGAAGQGMAEALRDPTRPPARLEAGTADDGAAASGPVLQSVLLSPQRRLAIISGQTLKVGDKFGEARLVKIGENEVVLRNGTSLQTLKLFPNVEKQPAAKSPVPSRKTERTNNKD